MARNAHKVAISLDRDLLKEAERLRKTTGESRSALMARALRELLQVEEERRLASEYVAAYRRFPETGEDECAARDLARRSMDQVEWDDS